MSQLQRWRDRLSNLTVSPLTRKQTNDTFCVIRKLLRISKGDYPDPSHLAHESARRPIEACETLEISEEAQTALQRLERVNDGLYSSFSLLLSALVVLLSRLTGDENVAIGTRRGNQVPFVLRTAVDPNEAFSTLLAHVEEVFYMLDGPVRAIYLKKIF